MGATVAAEEPQRHRSNLAALAADAATAAPDRTALVDERRHLTWAQLVEESTRVADGLSALGLIAGHRVALLLGNRAEFVTGYLAALGAGMVAVPLNPSSATGELVRVLADCTARVVVCDSATATVARAAVAGLTDALEGADEALRARTVAPRVVVVDTPALPGETAYDALGTEPLAARGRAAPPQDPETLAVLLYTAGTSGRPRAAMLPHRALLANIEQTAAISPPPVGADDNVLAVLPLFHVYGLNAVLGQVLRHRACLVMAERFEVERTLDLVAEHGVTNVPIAPPAVAAWASRDDLRDRLRGVRTVLSGASPLAPEVARRFEQASGLPVHQGYGLTEAAPVVTSTLCSPGGAPKPGSVGSPLPGVEVRIVDDGGGDVGGEDPGELWVRGPNLFCGYWPDGEGAPDADGWYATGDVGYLDGDGDLFLVDRLKEIVIVSGFNVYPVEVEAAIDEVEGVAEVAVIGAPADDDQGERVVAYVVADPGLPDHVADGLAEAVRAHCETRLAPFKRPREVHVVERLPHSVTGKVAKG
ncbi:MAG: AMP-binding protein, partial [Actinomycetota bacterium]|nr:AMP-binding protein [Actinomycetota bacterium]